VGTAGQDEVGNRLGWLTIASRLADEVDDLRAFASGVSEAGYTDVVLLGMGGSSLAPEVLKRSFAGRVDGLKLTVLDSTDADAVRAAAARDLDSTLVLVSTKSGGTIETLSAFQHFWAAKPEGGNYVAITDPGSSLVALADEHGFRRVFENDPTSAAGTPRCRTSGSSPRRSWASTSARCSRRRARPSRPATSSRAPTPGCGSA
jgi:glucose-6-phosphate isomerase/transaldolase/glucose-6-phosphate isomerase